MRMLDYYNCQVMRLLQQNTQKSVKGQRAIVHNEPKKVSLNKIGTYHSFDLE